MSKIEEDEHGNKHTGQKPGNRTEATTKQEQDKNARDSTNQAADQDPLFVDPNNKGYLSKDHSSLPEDERNRIS